MQNKLYQSALNLLARRDHSAQELMIKLRAKGYMQEDIKFVIERLIEKNLLNESRFVSNYIEARRRLGFGPLRIQCELKTKGIAEEMIAQHLEITDNAWLYEGYRIWQKQFKGKISYDFKLRAKQMRFLHYRGFTSEQIHNIIKEQYNNDE